jgi:catechol 2,3-dioxygenase-like lactoylglutathione lyase family enzyme
MPRTPVVTFDHASLPVRRLAGARKFFVATLGAIGMKINLDVGDAFGMGSKNEKIFWLVKNTKASGGAHFAFRVDHREEVDAFYKAALGAGGEDNGAPGLRPAYGPNYYAAFVYDPEGNNIEVVCYARGASAKKTKKRPAKKR